MATSVVVIADDLTGAADSAAAFARQGLRTMVLWDTRSLPDAEVWVFTTESRHGTQEEAVRHVEDVVRRVSTLSGVPDRAWIYKKVDSTLRGHPGPELTTVMDGWGIRRALVAPAFPAQGRVTLDGRVYVHGIPLADSSFGREVATSDAVERFAQGLTARVVSRLPLATVRSGAGAIGDTLVTVDDGIVVADAETDEDLDTLAEGAVLSGTRLLCGSAGLAGALTRALAARGQGVLQPVPPLEQRWTGGHVLVVAASRHPQTIRQVEAAEAAGIPVLRPGRAWFDEQLAPSLPRRGREKEQAALLDRCAQQFTLGPLIITSQGLPDLPGQSERIVTRLALLARELVEHVPPSGLVVTGGDMAMAVGRALEAVGLWLWGELQPGIPWGTWVGGIASEMPVITKAGGFGDDRALLAAIGDWDGRTLSGHLQFGRSALP